MSPTLHRTILKVPGNFRTTAAFSTEQGKTCFIRKTPLRGRGRPLVRTQKREGKIQFLTITNTDLTHPTGLTVNGKDIGRLDADPGDLTSRQGHGRRQGHFHQILVGTDRGRGKI